MIALVACGRTGQAPRVVVFGDSLVSGSGMPASQREHAWIRQVQRRAGPALELVDEGRGGRWTTALDELEAMMDRQGVVDLLVIALGTNDSGDVGAASVGRASANLRAMIARARERYGVELPILIVGPPSMRKESLIRTRSIADARVRTLAELNRAFARLARETGCAFVSLFDVVPPETMRSDGMHPDRDGNRRIAEVMLPAIGAALGARSARP